MVRLKADATTVRRPRTYNDPTYVASGFSRTSPRRLLHEMPELGDHELLHRQPHGCFRSRQTDDDAAGGEARARAAHDRGGSNLLIAEHPGELAEPVETLLQHRADRLV